jgi:hypothetical protein
MPFDAQKLMVGGQVVVQAEMVKQPGRRCLDAHHRCIPRKSAGKVNIGVGARSMAVFFNCISSKPHPIRSPF